MTLPDGTVFDSQGEYKRWLELVTLQKAGLISNLRRQVRFKFVMEIIADRELPTFEDTGIFEQKLGYVADFVYDLAGKMVVEDYKGFRTAEYKRKKRWMKAVYGIDIVEV